VGTKLPALEVTRSLVSATAKPQLPPGFGAGTVLVVFPDWCAQCRKMMKPLTDFSKVNAGTPLHAYGLMFHEETEMMGQAPQEGNFKELQGTATLLVPVATVQTLGVLDFPTAVVVDGEGVIRFIGMIPADAFNGDGYIGKVIQRMAAVSSRHTDGAKLKRDGQ
jgi:thiol-disulfide isomerase/thioredoxin